MSEEIFFKTYSQLIEKWRLNEFIQIIDDCHNEFADEANKNSFPAEKNYNTVLIHMIGKSLLVAREVILLCAHGYANGALSIARNLYEQMIIMMYFECVKKDSISKGNDNFDKMVNSYFLDYEANHVRWKKQFVDIFGTTDEKEVAKEEKEMFEAKAGKNITREYWWSLHNSFKDIINHVVLSSEDSDKKLMELVYTLYKLSNLSVHSSCSGNSYIIENPKNFWDIDINPSQEGCSLPLMLSSISLICVICNTCKNFGMDYTYYKTKLNDLGEFYHRGR